LTRKNPADRPLHNGAVVSKEAYNEDGNYTYEVTLDGWIEEIGAVVHGGEYLRALVNLRDIKPSLKVLLSIGGWESDGWCYMARTKESRAQFIDSVINIIKEYDLDGVDYDWEYPSNGGYGAIAHCPHCEEDSRDLLKETRAALDAGFAEHKLLTVADGVGAGWYWRKDSTDGTDFAFAGLDYVNVMCYDLDVFNPDGDQAGLGKGSAAMLDLADRVGDTAENRLKMNLGVPFYNYAAKTLVPYYKPWDGRVSCAPELIQEKMEWVIKNGFGGGFYWAYSMDVFKGDGAKGREKILQKTLYMSLKN